ncbi:hypothetical protein B296_00005677 [Ensete ventricosum]|uniref:Uncharacterized protein n=1 Tax=Ensete ventricosum TaxID=4639 RepID=A0A426ZSM4_ENSVE|nr:hypothetical protein B296_00005677 [Ensete ventricosum]
MTEGYSLQLRSRLCHRIGRPYGRVISEEHLEPDFSFNLVRRSHASPMDSASPPRRNEGGGSSGRGDGDGNPGRRNEGRSLVCKKQQRCGRRGNREGGCGKQGGSGGQSRDGEVAEESGVVAKMRGDGVVSRGVVQRLGRDVAAQLQEELAEFQPTSKETCRDGCSGGGREGLVSRYKARGKAPEQGRRSRVPDSGALQEKESGGSSDRFRSCRPKPCSSYVDGCAVRM